MNRKDEHIYYALNQNINISNGLENFKIKYYSMPNLKIEDISLKTHFCGIDFNFPFYINAITAGSDKADKINKDLEEVAKICDIFFFPGSYSPLLNNQNFYYPKSVGVNLGLDKNVNLHKMAINDTNAKILQVHVNIIQEMLMVEGEKNFDNWQNNLEKILSEIKIPIIIKETGFGMNEEMIKTFIKLGVKCIDISGRGGTSFSYIENMRSKKNKYFYEEIGYNTYESLKNAKKYIKEIDILASGGIKNPLEVVKCLAMGAKAVGISKYFLEILENYGKEKLIETINEWKIDLINIMILTNSKNLKELRDKHE